MWKHDIEMKKLLEYVNKHLGEINEDLLYAHTANITEQDKDVLVCDAYNETKELREYFNSLLEIHNTDIIELTKENIKLRALSGKLKMELESLKEEFNKQNILIGQLQERVDMTEEVIRFKDGAMENCFDTLNNSLFEASEQMKEALSKIQTPTQVKVDEDLNKQMKEALTLIKENASKITQTQRVKAGTHKPAKRIDVSDEIIAQKYELGMTPYKIAKEFNMTQQAIIYRLDKLGIYKGGKEQCQEDQKK